MAKECGCNHKEHDHCNHDTKSSCGCNHTGKDKKPNPKSATNNQWC